MNSSNNPHLTEFGVSENDLRNLVIRGLSRGGDWCDLFFENSTFFSLVLRDSKVSSAGYHKDYGCGIRVLSGDKTGYSYCESTDMPSLMAAASSAAAIADRASSAEIPPMKAMEGGNYYSMLKEWDGAGNTETSAFLTRFEAAVRRKDTRATNIIAMLTASVQDVMMFNSLGELSSDRRPLATLAATVVFLQNGMTDVANVSRSFRAGAEFLNDDIIEDLAAEAVKGVDERFAARRPKGGAMDVVMGAGASGILLHEAMGHAFEADFNRKGQSVFSGKTGSRVAAPGINIVDDGTISSCRGSINFDDEGVHGQKTYMVTDGILTSYLHDRISARHYGVSPTGNGRRESFRYNPIPRMRTTYMESGKSGCSLESLIGEVRNGVFVNDFSNGEVKIGEGDFTFYVKSGFLIENGRLTMPIKDINISGNGPEALANITGVADDLRIDPLGWTCGKGQSVPVGCGIPSVLVKGLTVGGE